MGSYGQMFSIRVDPHRSCLIVVNCGSTGRPCLCLPMPLILSSTRASWIPSHVQRSFRENKAIVIGDKQGVILPGVLHIVGIPISTYQTTSISISGLDRCILNGSHILVARGFDFFWLWPCHPLFQKSLKRFVPQSHLAICGRKCPWPSSHIWWRQGGNVRKTLWTSFCTSKPRLEASEAKVFCGIPPEQCTRTVWVRELRPRRGACQYLADHYDTVGLWLVVSSGF